MSTFDWAREAEKQWNAKSNSWNRNSKGMWDTGSRKDILPFFQKFVEKGGLVCDLGCGDGYGAYKLASLGYKVKGIDISSDMIQNAQSLPCINDLTFMKADIAKVKVEDASQDAVMAINSIEWTESPLAVLNEMKRIVKMKGYACIGILGPTAMPRINSYRRLYGEETICNTIMPWEFEQLAKENGWEKVGELAVYKREVNKEVINTLSSELKQAVSFMWVFMLRKEGI